MRSRDAVIERLADKNIRKWVEAEHAQERLSRRKVEENVGPFIALSRETGAGGSEIARMVAEKLGWDILDREIVDFLVSKYDTPRALVEFVDEKHVDWLEDLFTSWIKTLEFSSTAYVHRLHQLLMLAAHHGNVVIVGRGAHMILPRERGLSVRILAPLAHRVERVARDQGISASEARKLVKESDRQRESFLAERFHRRAIDPHMYDLVINVEKLTPDVAASLIVEATRSWMHATAQTLGHP